MFSNAEVCDFDSKLDEKLDMRLIEFLKKKQFYKDNNIEINNESLQKEFNIDKNDITKIKNYFQGKRLKKNQNSHSDMIQPITNGFPSEELKHDSRLDKIKKKQQRDKEANEQKDNYDGMSRGYDMYRNDRKFASAYGDDFKSRFNPQVWLDEEFYKNKHHLTRSPLPSSSLKNDNFVKNNRLRKDDKLRSRNIIPNDVSVYNDDKYDRFDESSDEDERNGYNFAKQNPNVAIAPNEEQILNKRRRYTNPNMYKHKKPDISYKKYIPRGCNNDLAGPNYSLDSIIGKLDTYCDNLSDYHRHSEMDLDTKISVPGGKCNNKRGRENNYQSVPQMNSSKMKDVDIENYLCYGNGPSRGAKSLGYPNPAEHYFQYISDDVQKPEHTVFEPGMPTRIMNKDTARPYKTRDVM